ncbi:hypothetical protein BUALT_Bualt16G0078800 [Buddleja alternifolia]|uniref:non-specific serine/threonine protein kinase n=1 Tax=Buddleja alternifolia TaxID=168488 RepID=A0AAV6WI80_9LAMI|nr:hypothetical protein BUALT_Bualt16G0078800 [Buddleja alternifolia]
MANKQEISPASAPSQLQNQKSNVSSSNAPLFGGIIIAIIILFVGGWLCFCFRRKLCATFRLYGKQKGYAEKSQILSYAHAGNLNAKKLKLKHFGLEELKKATNNFSEACLVGSGAFGNVYCGTFDTGGTVAIKKPHYESYTTTEEFRNEVRLLSKVKHDNLVGLVGFCEVKGPKAAKILVYEYVPNGSLLDYIIGRGGKSLTWRQRVNIAIGAAKGIAYLHEEVNPSIIHRDIKPSNILIGDGFEAKVSDFGLVRSGPVGDQSHVSSQVKGTPGYLDPAYCSSFHLTPFTDVYSFGVILLQLITARPAVESSRSNSNSHIIDWARNSIEKGSIEDILDANLLMEGCNMEMMLKMGEIGLRCVVKVPKERPTMTQVWQELEVALNSVDNVLPKHPLSENCTRLNNASNQSITRRIHQWDHDYSQSIVSVDGIGLERFDVDMDSLSFQSASLRCLETSISMDDRGF